MKQDDFYIGYAKKAPRGMRRTARWIYFCILVFVVIAAFNIVARDNEPFNGHRHEFGDTTVLSGIIRNNPYPLLEIEKGGIKKNILLVGFGKTNFKNEFNDGSTIVVKGYLIYGDGHTLLQVLESELEEPATISLARDPYIEGKHVGLHGTIIDPVCYFGVMKPGEGKIHRSCAVRCISGGIPPVFMTTISGHHEYFLLDYDDNVKKEEILEMVAKPCVVSGTLLRPIDPDHWNTSAGWEKIKVESLTPDS